MAGDRAAMMAWSAGVSAAAAGLAALFSSGRGLADHVLFTGFVIVGIVSFFILLATGIRKPLWSPELTITEAARRLAESRAGQVRRMDPMPVRWEVTDASRQAMPSELADDAAATARLAGEFQRIGPDFTEGEPRRLVILGDPGSGKTTLVSKLFLELLGGSNPHGVPVSIPAAEWGASDIAEWIGVRLKMARWLVSEALERGEITPVIEDLDELPPLLRLEAISRINDLGPQTPLLVTSRTGAYLDAVSAGLKPVRNAGVAEICPLKKTDAKDYLRLNTPSAASGRWTAISDLLAGAPGGSEQADGPPLGRVLTNPLMLWLARETYERRGTDPGELGDSARFGDQEAVEAHLLDEFILRKFAGDPPGNASRRRRRWTGPRVQRWMGFLAADLEKTRSRDIAWWRLPEMAPGGRPVTFALRGALLAAAAWYSAAWVVHRLGGWRRAIDPVVLLGGPLGHGMHPIGIYLRSGLSYAENHGDRVPVNSAARFISHSFLLFVLGAALAGAGNGAIHSFLSARRPSGATGYHISAVRIRWHGVVSALAWVLAGTLVITGLAAVLLSAIPGDARPGHYVSLFQVRSAVALLLAAFLWPVSSAMELLVTDRLDMSLLPAPDMSLRRQRRCTLLILLWGRSSRLAALWLVFGPVIALGYGAYEAVAVSCRIVLGGRLSASDAFDDARFWLACTGRMPWMAMKLLAEAERLEIVRRAGGFYQFRHVLLQKRLSARHAELSSRVTAAAMAVARWGKRCRGWRWPGGWLPRSAAPWTLPVWALAFEEHAEAACSQMQAPLGLPAGAVSREGPGVMQHFTTAGGLSFVLCAIPGQPPRMVAGPVWQGLRRAGEQAVHDTGRRGPAQALIAVGFPVDSVAGPDASCVSLAGGSLGRGLLIRDDARSVWRWEPSWTSAPWAQALDAGPSSALLVVEVKAAACWSARRLEIEDQRYRALPAILADSALARVITELSASGEGSDPRWRESDRSRQDRCLMAAAGGSGSNPLQVTTLRVTLYRHGRSTEVRTSARLEVTDIAAWQAARRLGRKTTLLSLDELISYVSAAWHVAADVLPALVVDDPVAVPPVIPPAIQITLSAYPDSRTEDHRDIRDVVDFSPWLMQADRQLSRLSTTVTGQIYLNHDDLADRVRQELVGLIKRSGYDPAHTQPA